jgi:transcriptional regulator with XRE-family HTH domain
LETFIDDLDDIENDPLPIGKDTLNRALKVGMIPGTRSLIKLADRFNSSIEFLIGLTDDSHFIKSEDNETFQSRFVELRNRNNVTKYFIGRKLDIDRSLFSCWERNDYMPSLEIAYQLSRFFKTSIDYLLGRFDDFSPFKPSEID